MTIGTDFQTYVTAKVSAGCAEVRFVWLRIFVLIRPKRRALGFRYDLWEIQTGFGTPSSLTMRHLKV